MDELTKKELEQIFHLLVDCTKASSTPVNSSTDESPAPMQPADRSVTQSVRNKPPTLTFLRPLPSHCYKITYVYSKGST